MLTFADLCAVVDQMLPGKYASVKVERSRSGTRITYAWQIYTEQYSWGAVCATADEALAELQRTIAGYHEQKVDPIEPPSAPAAERAEAVDIPF